MPMARYQAKFEGTRRRGVLASCSSGPMIGMDQLAQDGVSCSLCHQITKDKLGHAREPGRRLRRRHDAEPGEREEYGPYKIENGQNRIMRTSSGGYKPTEGDHIRQSELVRDLSHADHRRAGSRRTEDRRASRADAVSGMVQQRLSRQAELPELPHAGGRGTGARHEHARASSARACRATSSSAETSSCSEC